LGGVWGRSPSGSIRWWAKQWPWPRGLHGRLIETLRGAGARVIAFDIIFAEPSADPAQDQQLAERIGPDVVLAGDETVIETPQAVQTLRTEPLPALLSHGGHVGIASVSLDGDAVLRSLPTSSDAFAPILAGLVKTGAVGPRARSLIQYFGPPGSYYTVSYYQALDPVAYLPPDIFRDRTVIVGLSLHNTATVGAPRPENFATSYTATTGLLTAGPEVQATILDNIIHGLFIRPLPPWITAALTVVAVFLAALATHAVHPWRAAAAAIGGLLGFAGGSYLALRFGRVWVPPLLPVAGTVLAVVIETGQGYLTERSARRRISTAFGHYRHRAREQLSAIQETEAWRRASPVDPWFCDIRASPPSRNASRTIQSA
jgi:adenylate cyclase